MQRWAFLLLLTAPWAMAADAEAELARVKLAMIQDDKAPRGAVLTFTPSELNSYIRAELAEESDVGIREPKLELGDGTVSFEGLADFRKIAKSNGMFAALLEGERKVKIVAAPASSAGNVSVNLKLVEISGIPLTGMLLNLAADLVISRVFDDVLLDRPFAMKHNIDHAAITPSLLRVFIKK